MQRQVKRFVRVKIRTILSFSVVSLSYRQQPRRIVVPITDRSTLFVGGNFTYYRERRFLQRHRVRPPAGKVDDCKEGTRSGW